MTDQPDRPEFLQRPAPGGSPHLESADAEYPQRGGYRGQAQEPLLVDHAPKPRAGATNPSIFRAMALGLVVLALFIVAMLILWGCDDEANTASTDDVSTDDSEATEDNGAEPEDDTDGVDDADDEGEDDGDADDDGDAEANANADTDSDADADADADGNIADADSETDDDTAEADSDTDDASEEDGDFEAGAEDSEDADQPDLEAASVTVDIAADDVTLSGVVADLSTKSALLDVAASEFAPRSVIDKLDLDARVAQSEEPGQIIARGEVGTAGRKSTVMSGAAALADAAGGGFEVVDDLTISEAGTANAVAAEVTELFSAEPVQFDSGSSTIRPDSFPTLDKAATLLIDAPDIKVEIGGHTDDDGNVEGNATLSKARAEAVRDYIVRKGAAADQMLARGYGPARPIASNDTDEGKALNRRIEARPL